MTEMGRVSSPSQEDADRIIDYALTICMYGERAPGGDENWPEFGRRAEDYLRRRGCAKRGHHTPDDPACPECKEADGQHAYSDKCDCNLCVRVRIEDMG